MASNDPAGQAEHNRRTREAYDQLAAVWSATTDQGPWNGYLERPAFRSLVPGDLAGAVVLDAELLSDTWQKGGVEVTQQFWRRPLGAVIGAFADAGFVVDRVAEAQPTAEGLRLYPDELTEIVGLPNFIVYRLLRR